MGDIVARQNDTTTGVCAIHGPQSGTITGSASTTIVENELVARVGDIVTAACGHTGTIDANGLTTIVEGSSIATIDDSFSGVYTGTIDPRSGTTSAK